MRWLQVGGVCTLCFCASLVQASNLHHFAAQLSSAESARQPLPRVSQLDSELDREHAYKIQDLFVREILRRDSIAGFKAGLTSQQSRERFKTGESVSGVLFTTGRRTGRSVIMRSSFHSPLVETEIALIVSRPIRQPIASVAELRRYIRTAAPVIELADVGFVGDGLPSALDLVAANVGSDSFIVGFSRSVNRLDLDSVTSVLRRDGAIVSEGSASDVEGGPWESALWLVNQLVSRDIDIHTGQLLLTGALGTVLPAEPGRYVAEFGSLGKLSFDFR